MANVTYDMFEQSIEEEVIFPQSLMDFCLQKLTRPKKVGLSSFAIIL